VATYAWAFAAEFGLDALIASLCPKHAELFNVMAEGAKVGHEHGKSRGGS
jgi:hypothetical protein